MLGKKSQMKQNPNADSMSLEDRLIMSKHQIDFKYEQKRKEKEDQEI